jgi:alkylhydroperoxidase family enzyme
MVLLTKQAAPHYDTLRKAGYTVEQLRDIGRISSVITAVSKIMV